MSEPERCGPVRPRTESVRRGRKSKAEEEVRSLLESEGLPVNMCGTCGHVAGTDEDCEDCAPRAQLSHRGFLSGWRSGGYAVRKIPAQTLRSCSIGFQRSGRSCDQDNRDASESWPLLYRAVRCLAGHCDGAVMHEFQFNKRDSRIGQRLASSRWWTPESAAAIHLRLGKYRKQLAAVGIDYSTIPRPERVA